jgi:membrane protease YdiL (CAAX protease family)
MALLRTLGIVVGLFAGTYVPAFLIVRLLRLPLQTAVPSIMGITLVIAILLILSLCSRGRYGIAAFGFRLPDRMYLVWAIAAGIPLALALTWVGRLAPHAGPLTGLSLSPWKDLLYFGISAPIQEEIIFRGLLQTAASRSWSSSMPVFGVSVSSSALIVALLFGVIHFQMGWLTAAAAFVLGLVAGELRERSRSLLPAIVIHGLFNLAALLWVLRA